MQITVKEKSPAEEKEAEVRDGSDYMLWVEYEPGTWTKVHACVKGQQFGIQHGVWKKSGRGRALSGSEEQLRALEQYFRNNA